MWRNETGGDAQCVEPAHFVLGSLCPRERDRRFGVQHAEDANAVGKVQMCLERCEERELALRRQENPFLLAEGEGEESAHSDNDDEDYDDYGDDEGDGHGSYDSRHGTDEASDSSYFEGGLHSHLHQSTTRGNGDMAGGPSPHHDDAHDVPPLEDVEETPLKRRKCMHEGVRTMENPEEDDEGEDQQRQPSSSSRGLDADTAQQMVSDFVAEELRQFLNPQDDEPEVIDGSQWFVVGSQ